MSTAGYLFEQVLANLISYISKSGMMTPGYSFDKALANLIS